MAQGFLGNSGILTVNLDALASNYRLFQQKAPHSTVAGVVKANAYGLGLDQVVQTLSALNCPQFFVATLDEALNVRKINLTTPVAVLGGLYHGAEDVYLAHNILPVLNSPDDINRWQALAKSTDKTLNKPLAALIHFDTGMNRLGLSYLESKTLIDDPDAFVGLDVQLIMSHFACADEKSHPMTREQADNFHSIAKRFPNAQKSLANSSGLFRDSAYHYDMVRPGYALYGGNPTPESTNPMRSVVELQSRILQIRECKKGESIGYGASQIFDKDTRTATIATGYADGFHRAGSGSTKKAPNVYYKDQPCRVLGRVSMDLISIDLSQIKDAPAPQAGDAIEILGANQSVDDLATAIGTIGYEVLTSLGTRYKRVYKAQS